MGKVSIPTPQGREQVVGIDPGISPAVCFLDTRDGRRGCTVHLVSGVDGTMDEEGLRSLLDLHRPDVAYVELVGAMPGQGASSTAKFMVSWGLIRGILRGLSIPYVLVAPLRWKNRVLAGYDMGQPLPKLPPLPKGLPRAERNALKKAQATTMRKAKAARKEAQKQAAIEHVRRLFPDVSLIPSGCRVANHNIAEAVCLAAYGVADEGGDLHA